MFNKETEKYKVKYNKSSFPNKMLWRRHDRDGPPEKSVYIFMGFEKKNSKNVNEYIYFHKMFWLCSVMNA